ncbi:MAG: cadherin-like domain-containing protein [Proteobacteria bacterium]|nr:cadherin-like domain-containing protein [Pseudomonadota bacterium]
MHTLRWTAGLLTLTALTALTACGGDGGDEPQARLEAGADTTTLDWNTAVTIDALANDRLTGAGTLTLAGVGTPGHGSATVAAGKISYTPAASYFGPDAFSYTISNGQGVTQTGQISVTVEAQMVLTGRAYDAPLAGAAVTAEVGSARFSATADADGYYSLPVTAGAQEAFVVLTAAGAQAQAQVVLNSLVGEAVRLAAAVGEDGRTVADADISALKVTNITTAQAALATQINGGTQPATQAALDAANAEVAPDALLQMAALIRMVADGASALPQGVADTRALVTNLDAYRAFAAEQVMNSPELIADTQAAMAADPALALALQPVVAPVHRVYYWGQGCCTREATTVVVNPDGTGSVDMGANGDGTGAKPMTWTLTDGWIDMVLTTPYTNLYQVTTVGFKAKAVVGDDARGSAYFGGYGTWLDGNGEAQPYDSGSYINQYVDETRLVAPSATELTSHAWAGVPGLEVQLKETQDVLTLNADGSGTLARSGIGVTWVRDDQGVTLRYPDGGQLWFSRLRVGALGDERWLIRTWQSGEGGALVPAKTVDALIVPRTTTVGFTTDTVPGLWLSQTNAGLVTDWGLVYYRLEAGGTGRQENHLLDGTVTVGRPLWWRLGADGVLHIEYYYSQRLGQYLAQCPAGDTCSYVLREWTLLHRSGASNFVLEHLLSPVDDQYRTNRYDLTP